MSGNPCLDSHGHRKRRFSSGLEADVMLRRMLALTTTVPAADRARLGVYKCDRCAGYHIGKHDNPVRTVAS